MEMLSYNDALDVVYEIKHHTGKVFKSDKDMATIIQVLSSIYIISKEELIENSILSVHDESRLLHFNWLWD